MMVHAPTKVPVIFQLDPVFVIQDLLGKPVRVCFLLLKYLIILYFSMQIEITFLAISQYIANA